MKAHPDFRTNQKKFFGIDTYSDTSSQWNRAVNKFFDDVEKPKGTRLNANNAIGENFHNVQENV